MEELQIHQNIKDKLHQFIEQKRVPNILFYGPSGSGKRNIAVSYTHLTLPTTPYV